MQTSLCSYGLAGQLGCGLQSLCNQLPGQSLNNRITLNALILIERIFLLTLLDEA